MKIRHKLRVDMLGLTLSISAMIMAVVLIWFAGKLGEYHSMRQTEESLHQ